MAKYRVIAYETTALTYEIEADSPEAAQKVWEDTPSDSLACVDETFLGVKGDVDVELMDEDEGE